MNQEVLKAWNGWRYFLGQSDVQGEARLAAVRHGEAAVARSAGKGRQNLRLEEVSWWQKKQQQPGNIDDR